MFGTCTSYGEESEESKAILEPTERLMLASNSRNVKSAPMSTAFGVVTSHIIFVTLGYARAIRALRILELFNVHVFRVSACLALDESFTAILQHCDKAPVTRSRRLNETHKDTLQFTREDLF